MSSVQGGQPQFNPQMIQSQAAAKINAPQTQAQPTAKASVPQGPTKTTVSSQKVQQLTSEATKTQLKSLIQTAAPQLPQEMPQLKFLQKPSVGGNLAQLLGGHQAEAQQQATPQNSANNAHAAQAAGQLQTSHTMRLKKNNETEDSAWQNTAQSGRKSKKDDSEGEFSSLDDFESGGFSGGTQDDQRSDSQKKKQTLKKINDLKNPLKKPSLKKELKPPKGAKKKGFF